MLLSPKCSRISGVAVVLQDSHASLSGVFFWIGVEGVVVLVFEIHLTRFAGVRWLSPLQSLRSPPTFYN